VQISDHELQGGEGRHPTYPKVEPTLGMAGVFRASTVVGGRQHQQVRRHELQLFQVAAVEVTAYHHFLLGDVEHEGVMVGRFAQHSHQSYTTFNRKYGSVIVHLQRTEHSLALKALLLEGLQISFAVEYLCEGNQHVLEVSAMIQQNTVRLAADPRKLDCWRLILASTRSNNLDSRLYISIFSPNRTKLKHARKEAFTLLIAVFLLVVLA